MYPQRNIKVGVYSFVLNMYVLTIYPDENADKILLARRVIIMNQTHSSR